MKWIPTTSPIGTASPDARSLELDQEKVPDGTATLSVETCEELADHDDVNAYVHENFPALMRMLRKLKPEAQDHLLSYYLLAKTQSSLAPLFATTQTIVSFTLRTAVKTMPTKNVMWEGDPSVEQMRPILERAGLERLNLLCGPESRKPQFPWRFL